MKNNALQIKNNMSGNPTKVGIVSALVASEEITVSQLFISSAAQFFGVEVYSLNLRKNNQAVDTINKWVKLKTARNIPTIMDPHDLLPSSSIVLLNAIYFKKRFMHKCDGPRIKTFYGFNKAQLKIPFIRVQGDTFYESFQQLNSSAIMLKYEGGHLNLLIILPYDVDGLTQLENSIKGFDIGHITLDKYVVAKVWLPKFKLCTETDFKGSLEELGVKQLFHRANLSGILSPKTIQVDGIRQSALFDVSEETAGTSNTPKARRYSSHKSRPKKVKFKELGRLYLEEVYQNLRGGRVELYFRKMTLSTPDQDSDSDIPIIGGLVILESIALDHMVTEAGNQE
uniref:Serpin domain-containing protein n=1 Tax=Timema bartmani TaxID=61472 RepID=A0A7R9F0H1_9NEOP|nr:unnamed protein product [Timema bartmani]